MKQNLTKSQNIIEFISDDSADDSFDSSERNSEK